MIKILGFKICVFSGKLVLQALLLFLNLNIKKSEQDIVYDIGYDIVSNIVYDIPQYIYDIVHDLVYDLVYDINTFDK